MTGLGRRWAVRILAFALRHGATSGQVEVALFRSFPHRDEQWRRQLLADALIRNQARMMRSLGA